MSDHRITQGENRLNFSCRNGKFGTNINRGMSHSPSETPGSVLPEPLAWGVGGYTLWLEHVEDLSDPDAQWYWLMWYDLEGRPILPGSGIFNRDQLARMASQLMRFIP